MIKLIIPTDFSEDSWNALKYGIDYFKEERCHFYLMHASLRSVPYPVLPASMYMNGDSDLGSDQIMRDLKFLEGEAENYAENTSHKFSILHEKGSLIENLRGTILNKKIDYTLMGAKGVSGNNEVIVGSNAAAIITKVKNPVFIIPGSTKFRKIEKVLFPTDYNIGYSESVLRGLLSTCRRNQAHLYILDVSPNAETPSSFQKQNKEILKTSLQTVRHTLIDDSEERDLAQKLQQVVEREDILLIAMAAKNLNLFEQLLFEPLTRNLDYFKHIPFLVLHD